MMFSDEVYLISNMLIVVFIFWMYRNPYNHRIFLKLFRQKTAAISLGIMLFFWIISLLDSIRFRHLTCIDYLFYPLNQWMEYSYSKPFATQLLSSHMGHLNHLTYVSAHFASHTQLMHWAIQQLFGFVIILALLSVSIAIFLRKKMLLWRSYQRNIFWMSYSFFISSAIFALLIFLSKTCHVFGTGQIGQDILYQTIKSIRTGMLISLMTSIIMLPFALLFGLLAGYFGGLVDSTVQFIYTVVSSIPGVLLIGASLLSWQLFITRHYPHWSMNHIADNRLLMICVLLGLSDWSTLCRYIRAEVLKLRALDYIQSAKLLGSTHYTILFKHLLPNTMHMTITTVVLNFSYLVLAESVLTYLGVGVSPLTISWGNMINSARLELARDPIVWWPLLSAFIMMFFLVLACNLFADGLRKALNPREE